MSVLDKWWKDYRPFLCVLPHRHPLSSVYIVEGTDYLKQIEQAKSIIVSTFELDEDEFSIKKGCNELYAAVLIPKKGRNQEVMESAMKKLHFFRSQPIDKEVLVDGKYREWEVARFEPEKQDDVTEEVREKYDFIYHLAPSVFEEDIERDGLKLSEGGPEFQYSEPRAYVIKGDATEEEIQDLTNFLYNREKKKGTPNLTPIYTLFKFDLSKIDNDIRFFFDINEEKGLFVTEHISANAIVDKSQVIAQENDKLK